MNNSTENHASQGKTCCKEHSKEKEMNGQCCRSKNGGTRHDVVNAARIMFGLLSQQLNGFEDADLVKQPGGVKNHAIWSLGHITVSTNSILALLGQEKFQPVIVWEKLFGGGSQPSDDRSAYPSLKELMSGLNEVLNRVEKAYLSASSEVLRSPTKVDWLAKMCPTTGSAVVFLLTAHLSEHIGQVSAWRRAMGKQPLF